MMGVHRILLTCMLAAGCVVSLGACASMSLEEGPEDAEVKTSDQNLLDLRVSRLEERSERLENYLEELEKNRTEDTAKKKVPASQAKAAPKAQPTEQRQAPVASTPVQQADAGRTPLTADTAAPEKAATHDTGPALSPVNLTEGLSGQSEGITRAVADGGRPVEPVAASSGKAEPKPTVAPETRPALSKTPTGQSAYDAALALYNKGQYAQAQSSFEDFRQKNPRSSLIPNALYWQGECLYSLGNYSAAILKFKDVALAHPKHPKAAASLLKAGYSYERIKDLENARFYWQILLDDFPASAPAKLAKQRLSAL